jgi:hypothetical protein
MSTGLASTAGQLSLWPYARTMQTLLAGASVLALCLVTVNYWLPKYNTLSGPSTKKKKRSREKRASRKTQQTSWHLRANALRIPGVLNVGNTCFLASLLQVSLHHCLAYPTLIHCIRPWQHYRDYLIDLNKY